MALLTDIKNNDWQVSTRGSGNIEEGLNDVRQCLDVLLRTQKGTDPLRPDFGSDIYQHLDKPVNSVVPNVKRAIIAAVQLFETRVEIVSITHVIDISNIQFFVTYRLVDDDLIDQLQLYTSANGFIVAPAQPGILILEAGIPEYGRFQLLLHFIVNGNAVAPAPPSFGFANPSIMYAWVVANWGFFGNWYLLPDRLVLYMNPGIAVSASLNISVSKLYRYAAGLPALLPGESYVIEFTVPPGATEVTTTSASMGDLLATAIAKYGNYGTWVIESYDGNGDFDIVDFNNDDFSTRTLYQLVLYSTTLAEATLEVTGE